MNAELKSRINELVNAYSEIIGTSAEKKISYELECFLSYLAASDETITDSESDFVNEYLGTSIRPRDLINFITANNTYEEEYKNSLPELFKENIENEEASELYIRTFGLAGAEFIVVDANATEEEIVNLNNYMTMLVDYYNESEPIATINLEPFPLHSRHKKEANKSDNEGNEKEKTLDELLRELNDLIGLKTVKKNVYSLLHFRDVQLEREKRGIEKIPISNHLVFTGNPGTGKTTVARLLAKIYKQMGILTSNKFVEVDRSGLVAGYVGQTALKANDVIDSARGGILFIDEAYSLLGSGGYGDEAIQALLKRMEDERDNLIVIVAGYPKLMDEFLESNPGLRSRFARKIHFPDYTPEEMLEIFNQYVEKSKFTVSEAGKEAVYKEFQNRYANRDETFANAREVRNVFEAAVLNQADRIYGKINISDEDLCRLEADDFKSNDTIIL